jgi:LacI family transcriptional regulator
MTVGVLVEDIVNSFFTEVAKGVETVVKKAGYTMLLTSSDYDADEEYRLTRTLVQKKVDGILITPIQENSKAIEFLKSQNVPFFVMNNKSDDPDVSWVDTENVEGGYIGAKYLLELGHRRIMYFGSRKIRGTRERFEGFKKALKEAGIPLADQLIIQDVNTQREGQQRMDRFLEEEGVEALPSAIMTVNDAIAIGVMESLLKNGVSIPERVSIIGFDDINIAGLVTVPLTTVHQPKFSMGEIASYVLINAIEGQARTRAQQFLLKPHLVIRESCRKVNK